MASWAAKRDAEIGVHSRAEKAADVQLAADKTAWKAFVSDAHGKQLDIWNDWAANREGQLAAYEAARPGSQDQIRAARELFRLNNNQPPTRVPPHLLPPMPERIGVPAPEIPASPAEGWDKVPSPPISPPTDPRPGNTISRYRHPQRALDPLEAFAAAQAGPPVQQAMGGMPGPVTSNLGGIRI